jgi:hypothetical protein
MDELISSGIFESIMLICFGASWPMAIIKTIKAKNPISKSFIFLWLVIIGYIAGAINRGYYKIDYVFCLYILNCTMVTIDMLLSYYYLARIKKQSKE